MNRAKKWICWLLAAALLCPCLALAEETSAGIEKTAAGMWEKYVIREFEGEGLCFREWSTMETRHDAPLVVLYHGAFTDKGAVLPQAEMLADMGYVVVTPDLVGYGGSVTADPLTIFDIISRSAGNIDRILAYYEDVDYVDAEHFAVAGVSLGGMTALYYAANSEARPQCVAAFSSTPDFCSLLDVATIYNILLNGQNTMITTRKDMILIGYPMIVNSPDQKMETLLSVPVLMVNGGADAAVPPGAVQAFAEKAEAMYPGQLQFIFYETDEHVLPLEHMTSPEVKAFFEKNLPIGE